MIENNERGITINKALAWTMLVSVTGLIWWGGGTLASLQGAADRLTSALTETREMIVAERASSAQLEARVPAVSGKLSAALPFLYLSGGRDRMMVWDIHRNEIGRAHV